MNTEIVLGVGMFTAIIMALVAVILLARKQLVSTGAVNIVINEDPDRTLSASSGGKLLNTLADAGIFLSSACGGGWYLRSVPVPGSRGRRFNAVNRGRSFYPR